jgi:hypothetical protein
LQQEIQRDAPGDVRRLYNGIDLRHFRPKASVAREPALDFERG